MNVEDFREYCLSLPGAVETTPFDDVTPVYKVGGKMFALASINNAENWIALKCDPEYAIELRDRYPEITPAYHFNKRHWNGIDLGGDLPDKFIRELTKNSYDLVVAGLPRRVREELSLGI